MIRINLSSLAPTKAKRGGARRAVAAPTPSISIPGEGPGSAVLILIFVILIVGGMAGSAYWAYLENKRLQAEYAKALAENQRLSEVKAKYEAQKRKADNLERRIKVIDQLKENQKGPAEVLNFVADTINKTDAVWLESMTDDGRNLTFIGMALSADAVADLMANLKKTGKFKSVEIKETAQDPNVKEVQAFKFELICEKAYTGKLQPQA
jgi:Tfp pilus assembly protein PilN